MNYNIQKKADEVLNPFLKLSHFITYLIVVPAVALGYVYFDFLVLDKLSIGSEKLLHFNIHVFMSLLFFFVCTCLPIILIDVLISNHAKKKNQNNITGYEVIYDFIYEMIDNIFKCLSFFGILFQVHQFLNEIPKTHTLVQSQTIIQNKITVLIIFGLIIGIQQFILKCWFKTVRKFEDTDTVQTLNSFILFSRSKKKLKKCINNFEEIINTKRVRRDKKVLEVSLKKIFQILYNDDIKDIFSKYYKTKPILEIIYSKELQECKKKFEDSKDKSGIDVDKIAKELSKIKNHL
ncbi:hypothetical protein [Clostridium estertheticum]|uniref:hypothetical protein n=1 Tax=Clostridium estertheticum TaxID=238834 RepID=UPI001C0D9D54|nr:hypothetical protein [Clostridium estertheticum]MBU3075691.1 hypothetical protein [Clostridium estertheticum]MBU3165803.1 hypothetical protein [Clostridium estertheticum]